MPSPRSRAIAVAAFSLVPAAALAARPEPPAADTQVESWLAPRAPTRQVPSTLLDDAFAQSTNSFPDGDGPSWVAITPDGSTALVTNHNTDNIAVIDLNSMITIDMLSTPEYPEHIAVTPDGLYALTADMYNHTVSIFDLSTLRLVTSISTNGSYPYRVAISADSRTAVVGCINDASVSAFSVIDIPSRSLLRTFSTASQGVVSSVFTFETGQLSSLYSQFALTPDGAKVLSLDRVNGRVMIYSVATGAQLAALNCPQFPTAIRISASGNVAAVTHESNINQISAINIPAQTIASFPTGFLMSQTLAVTDDGSQAITVQSPANVVFTNLATGATAATITLPTPAQDLVLYDAGTRVFASGTDASIIDVPSRSLVLSMQQGAGYQAAVAAAAPVGVALNNRFREEIMVYQLDRAGSYPMGTIPTGMAPESDTPRSVAISPDGHTILTANVTSDNACIWDLDLPEKLTLSDVGARPLDAAFSPDGLHAAVVAADNDLVTFLDLAPGAEQGQTIAQVVVPARPVRVVYSADGSLVYVLCMDAKLLVAIDAATGAIINSVPSGTTRSSYSVSYIAYPSMTLSPDGTVLALCEGGASPPRLRLYDAATLAVLGVAPTGSYPLEVIFSHDSSLAYVASFSTNSVAVIRVTGGTIAKIGTIPTLAGPLTLTLDQTGQYLYVGCYSPVDPGLTVIDTASGAGVLNLPLDGYRARAAAFNPACSQLFIAGEGDVDDRLYRLHAAGPSTTILDQSALSWSASDLVISPARNTAIAAQPVFDSLDIHSFSIPVDLDADGVIDLADFFLFLSAFDNNLPAADLNADGIIDLDDFFRFLNGFDAGCT